MSTYTIVQGDLGPVFPVTLMEGSTPLVLLDTDIVYMNYTDPMNVFHSVNMDIMDLATGLVQRTLISGDLPTPGPYVGLVTVVRVGDTTFPRTFPSDGSKILIWCMYAIGNGIMLPAQSGAFALTGLAVTLTIA